MWHRLRARLRAFFMPGATLRDVDEELQSHVVREIERHLARGKSPDDARRAAMRAFGSVAAHREAARDAAGSRAVEHLAQDVRYALRTLRRAPGFTAVVVISLALGIGANTAIFSVADALLFRPLPVHAPDRLVTIEQRRRDGGRLRNFAFSDYDRFRAQTAIFAGMTATTWADGFNVVASGPGGGMGDTQDRISIVTGNFFSVLGVAPALGRLLTGDDDVTLGAHPVAVLSDAYWARRFGRASDVVGRTLTVNGTTFDIVGVTPREFTGDWIGWPTDFWVPVAMQAAVIPGTARGVRGGFAQFKLLGRLQPSVTREQAQAALATVHRQIAGERIRGSGVDSTAAIEVVSAARGYSTQREAFAKPLTILIGLVVGVLLIACANVASLSLARATARRREIAMRMAIGASRLRVMRQLLTESVLLALGGSALGMVVAVVGMDILSGLIASAPATSVVLGTSSVRLDLHLDGRILSFALGLSACTVIVFGLAPAVRGSRVSLRPALTGRGAGEGGGGVAARRMLVVLQVAVSVVLLTGASMFVRTLRNLRSEDLGADRVRLLLVWTLPGQTGRRGKGLRSLVATVHDRVASLPGVTLVSESGTGLLTGSAGGPHVWPVRTKPNDAQGIAIDGSMTVGPRFFETIGQPLLFGREFAARDADTSARVVIVNESSAQRLFGVENAVGQRLATSVEGAGETYEVVGVVKDARYRNPRQPAGLMTYWPLLNSGRAPRVSFVVRTAGSTPTLVAAIRREIRAAEPTLPVLAIDTIDEQLDGLLFQERMVADFSAFFGALALLLASVGLFGAVSYAAARRTREIGIRIALGARRRDVVVQVLDESIRLVVAGVVIGAPLALMLRHVAASLAYGIPSGHASTLGEAVVVLVAVGILAALVPARRAAMVDPTVALRVD
jgi:predicted permease